MKKLFFVAIAALLFTVVGCEEDEKESESTTGTVQLQIIPVINGEKLTMAELYKDHAGRDYWFTTLKFYLSNIALRKADGSSTLLTDVAFFDFEPNRQGGELDHFSVENIAAGTYSGIMFDAGVRQDYNSQDPAIYANDHPLSINNNMYWTWSTQYIFTKSEGYIINDSDTNAWFVHSGMEALYQSGIEVSKTIAVNAGGTSVVKLKLDLDEILISPNVIDLFSNGQSHTTDNMKLATEYQENLANSFVK